jgi:hypothetical protein
VCDQGGLQQADESVGHAGDGEKAAGGGGGERDDMKRGGEAASLP